MPSERVGSLYVAVGVDGDEAILEAKKLNRELYKVAKQIQLMGNGASFNAVTTKLRAVAAEAEATSKKMADAATGRTGGATDLVKQQEAQYAALLKAREQDNKALMASVAAQAVARQKAAADAAKAEEYAARKTMASIQAEAIAANIAFDKRARAAERAAVKEAAAAAAAAKAVEREYEKQARAAERAAAREIRAAELVAASRRGAAKRGTGDLATAGAAAVSGNPGYALASLAQAGTKLTGVFSGMSAGAVAAGASIATIGVAAVAAEAGMLALTKTIAEYGLSQAANLEMLGIQLTGLLGSAEKGAQEMQFLLELGKESIVPTESLIQADRLMLAFGVSVDSTRQNLVQFMSDFGTATGATQEQVYFLSLALGQVASFGRANSVDMRQLANAGINTMQVYKIIGDEIGMSAKKVAAGVSEGVVTADRLFSALTVYSAKFADTAEAARNSTQGLLANIKDYVSTEMGLAFAGLNKELAGFLKGVYSIVKSIDFTAIANAIGNVVDYIRAAFNGVETDGRDVADFFSQTLPQAINIAGAVLGGLIRVMRTWFEMLMLQYDAIRGAVSAAIYGFAAVALAATEVMDTMGVISDEAGAQQRARFTQMRDGAHETMVSVVGEVQASVATLAAIWEQPLYKPLYVVPAGPFGSDGRSARAIDASTPEYVPPKVPKIPVPSLPSSSGSSTPKENPAVARFEKLIDKWEALVDRAIGGRDALFEAFNVPFAPKLTAGMGIAADQAYKFSDAFKAFSSGDVDSIITQYKDLHTALMDFYSLGIKQGGKYGKQMRQQRDADIRFLKKQTGELVRLAGEAEAIRAKLEKLDEDYDKASEALSKRRAAIDKQRDAQARKINNQYDGYYSAISATEGKFVKGSIQIANEALASATDAYEKAQAKLDELLAAREAFLSALKDMAYSFVNDLSKVNEEITRFTRLDNIGSFSSVTEQVANTASFTRGLQERLTALKQFVADTKTLMARGLDGGLLQQIMQSGPEVSGGLASSLAGASQAEIDEINRIQSELATEVGSMQQAASAQWFDAGIAAQQAFTAPLKAAMDAAAAQVAMLEEQKALALGILEAWHADQNAALDAEQEIMDAKYEEDKKNLEAALLANQTAAEGVAKVIDARLNGLAGTAYASGMDTIQGLIDGLSDDAKLKELKAAAAAMAAKVKDTINSVLGVKSPSTVMMETGKYVGEGLAVGMDMSEPMVADAAARLGAAASTGIDSPNAGGNTVVKVFIGDQELRDLVDVQIARSDIESGSYVMTGRRL